MTSVVPFVDLNAMTVEVRDEIESRWSALLTAGDFVRGDAVIDFEEQWARYCGTDYAVGVANGTDALSLALRALRIGPGDDVVLPTNTFVATAEAVAHVGARPRFADVDPDTLLLTAETVQRVLTPRTRAVIAVHLFGQMPDMDAVKAVADSVGAVVIEDAAQAHGAQWRGRRAGSLGAVGCFSFYPGKNLGAFGDAGAVVTSDPDVAARIRSLGDHGRAPGRRNWHSVVGFNSRLDTAQAIVLSVKLAHLDRWNAGRRAAVAAYRERLADSPVRLVAEHRGGQPVYHLAVAQVDDRGRVQQALADAGIATGIHYPQPCHLMAPYHELAAAPLPIAEAAADRILSLPVFPHMTTEQVDRVTDVLCAAAARQHLVGARP